MAEPEITEDQASEALQQLNLRTVDEHEAEDAKLDTPAVQEEVVETAPVETETAETVPEETGEQPAESDDVESLKARITTLETENTERETRHEARAKAVQQRYAENEQILRNRFLKKSNVVNQVLGLLKQSRSETGVPEADVDRTIRELESTMNPNSASYVPPQEQQYGAVQEDQSMVLNNFLNEMGMDRKDADDFGGWIRTEAATVMSPGEQAVAGQSLDGFLRIAHQRYNQSRTKKDNEEIRNDAVGAVRSVQQTQKAAARAASASTSSPRKQKTASGAQEVDFDKVTPDDVSSWMRQSVERYK